MSIADDPIIISASFINESAKALGFFDCGISKAEHLTDDEKRTEKWLKNGLHAEMHYMERNKEKRYDPTKLVDNVKSVITVLYAYAPGKRFSEINNYKISSYAYGADYHKVVKNKLHQLLKLIEEKTGKRKARIFVDSAPVLDRAWAQKSGLGFIGKNTMLINRKGGSFFFIGHIMIDLELEYNKNIAEKNYCGSCTLCIKACPTNAFTPFVLDAGKCISYLTIENKGNIPMEFKDKFDNWIFGCDICQDVCPWNRNVKPHNESLFNLSEDLMAMKINDWHEIEKEKFEKLFSNSAVLRAGFKGLKRNIQFVEE